MKRHIRLGLAFLLGFTTLQQISPVAASTGDITPEDLLFLDIPVVTAGKKAEKISDIPASVYVVTRKDIERYGYTTLPDILQNVPGMFMLESYAWNGGTNFGVRGFFSKGSFSYMTVMVNGITQMEDFYNSFKMERINVPVEAIDRIEVIRGPMAVIYGSSAFFGAINIITNQVSEKEEENTSLAAVTVGSLDTEKGVIRVTDAGPNHKSSFNAAVYSSDGLKEPYSRMMSDTSALPQPRLPNWGWNMPADSKTVLKENTRYFEYSGAFRDFTVNFSQNLARNNEIDSQAGVGKGSFANVGTTNISLVYDKKFSPRYKINAKAIHVEDSWRFDDEYYYENYYSNTELFSKAYELELTLFAQKLADAFDVTSGVNYRSVYNLSTVEDYPDSGANWTNEENFLVPGDSSIDTKAFFSQVQYKANRHWQFVGGLRFETLSKYTLQRNMSSDLSNPTVRQATFDQDAIRTIPRAAAIYSLNDRNIFKLLYGQSIKQPSFISALDLIRSAGTYGKIPPIEAAEMETIELNYLTASQDQSVSANFSVFRNNLDKLVTLTNFFDGTNAYIYSDNSGKMVTNGVEAGVKLIPSEPLTFDLSAVYQESKNMKTELKRVSPSYSPHLLGYAGVSYALPKDVIVGFSGRYVDKMKADYKETTQTRIGQDVPAYTSFTLNLRANKLFARDLYGVFTVSNIFNETIRYPTESNEVFDKGTLGKGRIFLVSLGYKF